MQKYDARIIFVLMYHKSFSRVLCHAYRAGITGAHHVWITDGGAPSSSRDLWDPLDPSITCTATEMYKAVEGVFENHNVYLTDETTPMTSGKVCMEFYITNNFNYGENM